MADPSLGLAEIGYGFGLDTTAFNGLAATPSGSTTGAFGLDAVAALGPAVDPSVAAQFGLEPTVTGPALGFSALDVFGLDLHNVVAQVPTEVTQNPQLAFAGKLVDARYDEVIGITHCTYSTPFGTYTHEWNGYRDCPPTTPAPFDGGGRG